MRILLTGGTGYIGSHTAVELLQAGHQVVLLDNLSNSKASVVEAIQALCGVTEIPFYACDIRDGDDLDHIFVHQHIDAVIHFAGLKAVGESCQKPLEYYDANVNGTLCLLDAMRRHGCRHLVFSSSATVYGSHNPTPYREDMPIAQAASPYGNTKVVIERILQDLQLAEPEWHIALLRYFNPVGAHSSGTLGEDPNGIPNNIVPMICNVARGLQPALLVYGNDYPTPDGTCVRDYIHVQDLALGHLKAVEHTLQALGCSVFNLGSGQGVSVLELVRAFESASGRPLPLRFVERRAGDLPAFFADPTKAARELGWHTTRSVEQMCCDVWHFLQTQKWV